MSGFRKILWIFLLGVTLGGLMGISLKYPVKAASIEEANRLCQGENLGIEQLKVGLSGKMYYVRCKSQKTFTFK